MSQLAVISAIIPDILGEPVFEIMEVNEEIRDLIAEGGSSEELENAARRAGMCTLHDNGIRYVLEGITSIEEMLKVSYE